MLQKIMLLMIIGMLGIFSSTLSWAASAEGGTPEADPAMSKGIASGDASPSAKTTDETGYLIGPGDVLDISVWKDEALTRSCVVRPDGFISFPLIGEIPAAGRTALQLKAAMETRLSRYVPGVELSLELKQINSLIIYVIGKVNSPGRFALSVDVNVLQALATAGGLNVFAKRDKIKVFRQGTNETTIFPFDYDSVVEGKRLEQNIHLKRGDVVVIP
ncbi:MAG: polysaccharide biosynthesis/export family protein [Nitrospirota bacterium]